LRTLGWNSECSLNAARGSKGADQNYLGGLPGLTYAFAAFQMLSCVPGCLSPGQSSAGNVSSEIDSEAFLGYDLGRQRSLVLSEID
jgi:hypothetical protein